MQYLVCSPCPIDPGGTCVSLHDRYALLPATLETVSASTLRTYEADRLHAFALRLSHFTAYA